MVPSEDTRQYSLSLVFFLWQTFGSIIISLSLAFICIKRGLLQPFLAAELSQYYNFVTCEQHRNEEAVRGMRLL